MKKKLKHLLWIKLAFVSLLFCSISLLTAETTERRITKRQKRFSQLSLIELKMGSQLFNFFFIF